MLENIKIRKTKSLLVLYECETPFIKRREGDRLRKLENILLRRIFGPKRDGITGKGRKFKTEEIHSLYFSPDIYITLK